VEAEYEFTFARDAANKKKAREKKKEDKLSPSTVNVGHEDYDPNDHVNCNILAIEDSD
jgi:hypothetical protein